MGALDWTLFVAAAALGIAAGGHALLWKRDSRAALGWILVCLLLPVAGSLLYFGFGINRIRTRARKYHGSKLSSREGSRPPFPAQAPVQTPAETPAQTPPQTPDQTQAAEMPPAYGALVRVSNALSRRPLVVGNRIEPLHNGEEAYPRMLAAIDAAEGWVYLTTYLFETGSVGREFIDRLSIAAARGIDVRVLVDGVGELYAHPRASRLLDQAGVRVARFLPPKLIPPAIHVNLRNHRKILVADGRVAFTGGMNLGERHLVESDSSRSVIDVHFQLGGPIVGQMQEVFLDDWRFVTGDSSAPPEVPDEEVGPAICRCLVDGPNEDIDRLLTVQIGAISAAHRCLWIVTPYFVPPRELIAALRAAALRGVEVSVILPAKNNLPYVHWATMNLLWELLEQGVRVYLQPPPFAHTKLFVVDDLYAQIGSANVDPRSLRLNFELVVEVFDDEFARGLATHCEGLRDRARRLTLAEVDGRSLPIRIRDSLAWLASPYL